MSIARRKSGFWRLVARRQRPRALPRYSVLFAAIALFAQLLALPYHHPEAPSDPTRIAADLKATFGDVAVLCVAADDDGSAAPKDGRHGHCDDGCPLCQFGAQTVLFVAPVPALPARRDAVASLMDGRADFAWQIARPAGFAQPRAPPFAV